MAPKTNQGSKKRDRVKRFLGIASAPSNPNTITKITGPSLASSQQSLTPPDHIIGDAPAKGLWNEALQTLSDKQKTTIFPFLPTSRSSMPDLLRHLLAVSEEKRAQCEQKAWKFELNGRQVILRDVAENVISWINKFKEVGDVAANFDPAHFSLPWAGVRFLLEVRSLNRRLLESTDRC